MVAESLLIQSLQNPVIKRIARLLTHRRERLQQGLIVIEGEHLLQSALEAGCQPRDILLSDGLIDQPPWLTNGLAMAKYHRVAQPIMTALSQLDSPSVVIATLDRPTLPEPKTSGWVLALDAVQDPGNVGTLLRTAAAAGVDQVWLGMGCADLWSPKVLRAGMGAHWAVACCERLDLARSLQAFNGDVVVSSLGEASALWQSNLSSSHVLLLGSEGQGVDPALQALAGQRVHIPMSEGVESLNVAAAAAILLYEAKRQRLAC